MQYLCNCNFSIPRVSSLPWHDHNQAHIVADMLELNPETIEISGFPIEEYIDRQFPLRDGVNIYIDWKAVARSLMEDMK